jgi:hypothetical protein
MKSFVLAAVAVVLATGCAAPSVDEGEAESGAAQTKTKRDLLAVCDALDMELLTMVTSIEPSKDFEVEKRSTDFDGAERIGLSKPIVRYAMTFRRAETGGAIEFKLSVGPTGPFSGIDGAIDSPHKSATITGRAILESDTAGRFVIDAGAETLERITGVASKTLAFSGLDCSKGPSFPRFNLSVPVVALEAVGETQTVKNELGKDVQKADKVKWTTRSASGPLQLRGDFG